MPMAAFHPKLPLAQWQFSTRCGHSASLADKRGIGSNGRGRNLMVLATLAATLLQVAAPDSAPLSSEVNAANIKWVDATRRQDFAMLTQIMAPDYVVTYHDGKVADLPTWLGRFHKIRMLDCGATIINLRVTGPDAAEATVSAYWDAILASGKPFRETYTARDTWNRRGGRWVVVRRDVVDMRVLN
ncbi:nuclear transport factor 2 family protein [Sphingomonas sp. SM33]|uniref:Nuclear transport factor 2 family protein n=1 Tax=Sphingomonas telluris TaxID=2907998 RepID=A0ABS9VI39_9SPHN|nr:nuclear transport factor 2 family protein [Sphingomonas telluris]MCH8614631.1 nuclear transport factor 2 family protein [Sphingomonas telluris]